MKKIGFIVGMLCIFASIGFAQPSVKIGGGSGNRAVIYYIDTLVGLSFDNDDDGDYDVSLTGSGQIRFSGALMPNGLSGNSGDILRSNGSSAPSWASLQTLAWTTTGNSGTNASTNFIGTTDNTALAFRTGNVTRAEFYGSTGGDDSGSFVPKVDNVYSLGTPTNRWKDLYLGPSSIRMGGFINGASGGQSPQTLDEVVLSYDDGFLNIDKDIQLTGDMIPVTDDLYTLGNNDNRWADLYVGGNSIHIGTSAIEGTISYDDATMELNFSTDGAGEPEITMGGSGGVGTLGIGTSPNTSLDVNGDVSFRFSNITLTNGINTAIAAGGSSALRITGPTGAFEIHGIAGGENGKVIELYNASGHTMRMFNQSATESTAANRIITGTGHSFEIRNMCGATLVYNPTDSRWVMTASTRNTSTIVNSMNTYASFGGTSQAGFAPDYGYVCHRVSSSGNVSIFGINSTGVQDGTLIILLNVGNSNIALQNESNNAADASYRIITGTGNNETLGPNKPATLIYDGTSQRWRFISGR